MLNTFFLTLMHLSNSIVTFFQVEEPVQYGLIGASCFIDLLVINLLYFQKISDNFLRLLLLTQIALLFSTISDIHFLVFCYLYHLLVRFQLKPCNFALLELAAALALSLALSTELRSVPIVRSVVCALMLFTAFLVQANQINQRKRALSKLTYSPPVFANVETSNNNNPKEFLSSSRYQDSMGHLVLNRALEFLVINNPMANLLINNNITKEEFLDRVNILRIDSHSKHQLAIKSKSLTNLRALLHIISTQQQNADILVLKIANKNYQNYMMRIYYNQAEFEIYICDLEERDQHLKKTYLSTTLKQVFKTFSHEFGTSLNYLLAIAQTAIDSQPDVCTQFYPIKQMGEIMHHFVLDLGDFNDIISEKFEIQFQSIDVESLVQEVINLFADTIYQKGLTICYKNELTHSLIVSDGRRIKQILINLISNAQKFTTKGNIDIIIRPIDNNTFVQFEVIDTGYGMRDTDARGLQEVLRNNYIDHKATSQSAGFGLGCFLSNCIAMKLANLPYEQGGGLRFEKQQIGMKFFFLVRNSTFIMDNLATSDSGTAINRISKFEYVDLRHSQLENSQGYLNSKKYQKQVSLYQTLKIQRIQSFAFKDTDMVKESTPFQAKTNFFFLNNKTTSKQFSLPFGENSVAKEASENDYVKDRMAKLNRRKTDDEQSESHNFETHRVSQAQIVFDEEKPCDCTKILIVDDEMINIIGLRIMLNSLGHTADQAFNGQEAIAKIIQKREGHCKYKAVFMDINMPIMDGFAATKEILRAPLESQPSIVACTAFSDAETRTKCYEIGMKQFLTKPVNKLELIKVLSFLNL